MIQITGKNNYTWASQFGYDLIRNPDTVASNVALSATIAAVGIRDGQFGNNIDRYINSSRIDFMGARNSVNSRDRKYRRHIANVAHKMLAIFRGCRASK